MPVSNIFLEDSTTHDNNICMPGGPLFKRLFGQKLGMATKNL